MSAPAQPPDVPVPDPDRQDRPRTNRSLLLIVLVVVLSLLVLLLLGGFALYLTWQHPSLTGPLTAATAAVTVPLTVIGIVLAMMKR
ncbi:hypothetical protein ABZ595_37120 [Streptomyces rubradiris]|uniref:hypothetical protein n=1 Tax=Streptomyces rubradiris TaxID=285531 RepID=UPI0033DC5300